MATCSNQTSRKRDRDDRVDFEYTYTGQPTPINLTHVRFHSSITEIYNDAFKHCYRLQEVIFHEGLQKIGNKAFLQCGKLERIKLPSTLNEIDNEAFISCSSLKEVVLNEGLNSIEIRAFGYCISLQSIAIPSTVSELGSSAFHRCTNLRDVVLTNGLQRIGQYAFSGCSSLVNITIPSTLVEIGHNAFSRCTSLREIVIHNEEVLIGDYAFVGCILLEMFKFPSLSTRLDNMIQVGHRDIEAKLDDIPAVEWRGGELSIPSARREIENTASGRVETLVEVDTAKLGKVVKLIRYYEIKEAAALFELALWKSRIDQTGANDINRNACRIEVPGPVKDVILQYLGWSSMKLRVD